MTTPAELDRKLLAAVERLGRALRVVRQQVATRHQLSLLQVHLLELLADRRPRRVGELAAELDVSQPTVSEAVATLQGKGLATRRRAGDDARAIIVALTRAGTQLATSVAADLAPLLDGDHTTEDDERGTALRVVLGEISRFQRAGIITINRSCLSCLHYRAPAGATQTAHCLLLDQPLGYADLRIDCPEHGQPPGQPRLRPSPLR